MVCQVLISVSADLLGPGQSKRACECGVAAGGLCDLANAEAQTLPVNQVDQPGKSDCSWVNCYYWSYAPIIGQNRQISEVSWHFPQISTVACGKRPTLARVRWLLPGTAILALCSRAGILCAC